MIKDLIIKNRSYRGYDENYSFTKEQLVNYVDGARFCASSLNIQPLKYYIAWEKADVHKIRNRIMWARQLPQITLPHPGKQINRQPKSGPAEAGPDCCVRIRADQPRLARSSLAAAGSREP